MKAVIFSLWFIVSCMMISAVSTESSDQIDSQNNLEFEVYRDMAGDGGYGRRMDVRLPLLERDIGTRLIVCVG